MGDSTDGPRLRSRPPTLGDKNDVFNIENEFPARLSCVALFDSLCVILLFAVLTGNVLAQESKSSHAGTVTPLSDLLAEAEKTVRRLKRRGKVCKAAKQVRTQVSTLPDPQFNFATCQRRSPPLCRLHQQRLCLSRPRCFTRHSIPRQVALEG